MEKVHGGQVSADVSLIKTVRRSEATSSRVNVGRRNQPVRKQVVALPDGVARDRSPRLIHSGLIKIADLQVKLQVHARAGLDRSDR